ncbi:MAG: CHAT domain-containing protein [Betaproteobacteria bacterium]|nr:CHAT domain-containing protein [Betaproteobacteria bacterium]
MSSPSQPTPPIQLLLPKTMGDGAVEPPEVLRSRTRGGALAQLGPQSDPLLATLTVEGSIDLNSVSRAAGGAVSTEAVAHDQLLALETAEGETLFIRADRLLDVVSEQYPDAIRDGKVDFLRLQSVMADEPSRAGVGRALWRTVKRLALGPDPLADDAQAVAQRQVRAWVKSRGLNVEPKEAMALTSWAGAQALMAAVESQLADEEGVYHWHSGGALQASDCLKADDGRLKWAGEEALLFIHGTASSTLGSFSELASHADAWGRLRGRFGERIFALEHRTFSRSPIDNALTVARLLPPGAAFSLVTHSRGGLVGDLLCLGSAGAGREALLRQYQRRALPDENVEDGAQPWARELREWYEQEERKKLGELFDLLDQKKFRIRSYVRVAAPAAGTLLAAENLDVFLSGLLGLVVKALGWAGGLALGSMTGGAGAFAGRAALDKLLAVNKRIVLEIAKRRFEPHVVPGIEAMLPDAPLGRLLVQAPRQTDIAMAVIAGDLEGGAAWWRVVVAFTDRAFFNNLPNDLVVNTRSMLAGVAAEGAHVWLERASTASHFSYFRNATTRSAVLQWLVENGPRRVEGFTERAPLPTPIERERLHWQGTRSAKEKDRQPVLILLPGIMGSHLEVWPGAPGEPGKGNRIWLDVPSLAGGGLARIAMDQPGVSAEDVLDNYYGGFAEYISHSHWVECFAYDWREDITRTVQRLQELIKRLLKEHPNQPVRLVSHSMGGLVVRELFKQMPDLWKRITDRPGGRWVMLGTPNHGSYSMVENLLGRSARMRALATLDFTHSFGQVLQIASGFKGALQLLPRPGFVDAGASTLDLYRTATWASLAAANNDRLFGRQLGGQPAETDLKAAKQFWSGLEGAGPLPEVGRIAYVCGQGEDTPCGVDIQNGRVRILCTSDGDGTVTWASSKLDWLSDDRYWCMPAKHGDLVNTQQYFDALRELLDRGVTTQLKPMSQTRGAAVSRIFARGPASLPEDLSPRGLVETLLGGSPSLPKVISKAHVLRVAVRAMDLRYVQAPIMVGHYEGDPISYAEALIDQLLVGGGLSERSNAGVYAGRTGTSTLVMMPSGSDDTGVSRSRGALVVGMGRLGELTRQGLLETVRAGVIRYLFDMNERAAEKGQPPQVELYSLLLGYSSSVRMSVRDSVATVTLGIAQACEAFRLSVPAENQHVQGVTQLTFVELYRDAATTAAHVVRQLPELMASELAHTSVKIKPDAFLIEGEGARERLTLDPPNDQWPQMQITSADDPKGKPATEGSATLPGKLRFIFTGRRARSEETIEQNQPSLVESLVSQTIRGVEHHRDLSLGRTLFHLLVPVDYMEAAKEADNILLMLDAATANIPWEMLEADGEPLVVQTRVVRTLITSDFRPQVREAVGNNALVIGNPSTAGFRSKLDRGWAAGQKDALLDLPGAEQEAEAIVELLKAADYEVTAKIGPDVTALEVFNALYERDYRILTIAAHGVFELIDAQGMLRSGVALSGGLILGAAEVGKMHPIPELVFLNCCHLGRMRTGPNSSGRLAASLAHELIKAGVRCVVVAGWEVEDAAAKTFALTLLHQLVREGSPFGDAVYQARKATYYQHPDVNTFGAYQAYGNPVFRLHNDGGNRKGAFKPFASIQELYQALQVMAGELDQGKELDVAWVKRQLDAFSARSAPGWMESPGVQARIGSLYAKLGEPGAKLALEHLGRAMAGHDRMERVPLGCVELAANLQARYGRPKEAGANDALHRLHGLLRMLEPVVGRDAKAEASLLAEAQAMESRFRSLAGNGERAGILGSALKRKVVLLCAGQKKWTKEMSQWASLSARAYLAGVDQQSPGSANYGVLNAVAMSLLADNPPFDVMAKGAEWANAYGEGSKERFNKEGRMWDAVGVIDAEVTAALVTGEYESNEIAPREMAPRRVAARYVDATKHVPGPKPQWDSVIEHWRILARLFRCRASETDLKAADWLEAIAVELDNLRASTASRDSAKDTSQADLRVDYEVTRPAAARRRQSAKGKAAEAASKGTPVTQTKPGSKTKLKEPVQSGLKKTKAEASATAKRLSGKTKRKTTTTGKKNKSGGGKQA